MRIDEVIKRLKILPRDADVGHVDKNGFIKLDVVMLADDPHDINIEWFGDALCASSLGTGTQ